MRRRIKPSGTTQPRSPWLWVPSLYYAEGIPYVVVMLVSVIFYKRMGVSNTDIALYTSWLYLPWVIKPLWSPVVDILRTKRFWIIIMQLIIGAGLGGIALTIPLPNYFKVTLGFLWLLAFSSATHDIAADGFYMLGLSPHKQAWFVGVRSTFYRLAMITGQGLLIIFAGYVESHSGLPTIRATVAAKPTAAIEQLIIPDSLYGTPREGKLRVISEPLNLEISTVAQKRSETDSIIAFAKNWNITHGHTTKENLSNLPDQQPDNESWWQKAIVTNLEKFLSNYFGENSKEEVSDVSGNVGILYFHLSKEPEQDADIVINFGRQSGDKSIGLATGERLIFNKSNWNIPALAVIQLDSKLNHASQAIFSGRSGNIPLAWTSTFLIISVLFLIFFVYHKFILPYPDQDTVKRDSNTLHFFSEFLTTFIQFFKKDRILISVGFILIYRFGEAQLVKMAAPFMLDSQEVGGLALTTGQVGFIYGTLGLIMLTLGGLLGGFVAARHGLKYWIWWMALAMKLPDAVYVYLSSVQPDNFFIINLCVGIEQFGYGFGFTAYMLFMILVAEGEHKTAHYAICTGFMALGMMIPGMFSGWLQEIIGYQHFFIWVLFCTIPGLLLIKFIFIDPNFGKNIPDKD